MAGSSSDAQEQYRDLKKRGRWKRYEIAELAAADVNVFAEHCFGSPTRDFEQQPVHVDFHAQCDASPRAVLWTAPEMAKTFQLGFVRGIHRLGNNHDLHRVHVGATAEIPDGTCFAAAKHIHHNEAVREVFPTLRIAKGPVRSPRGMLYFNVERGKGHTDRDYSWLAAGQHQTIMGRRIDDAVLDDVHDFDNTYTKTQTEKVVSKLRKEVLSRLGDEARVVYIGHPWRKHDFGWWASHSAGWTSKRYDIETGLDGTPNQSPWPKQVRDPNTGKPFGYPWRRVLELRTRADPFEWRTMYRCLYPDDDMELFASEHLRVCLDLGRNMPYPNKAPEGSPCVTGVDVATGSGRDETVLTTMHFAAGRIIVDEIRGGVWDESRMWKEFRNVLRSQPQHLGFMVEDNGMQKWIVETSKRSDVMRAYGWRDDDLRRLRVKGRTTTKQKHAATGLRSLAIDIQNHTVVLPSDATGHPVDKVARLISDMEDYDPLARFEHTGDYLISYWYGVEMLRQAGLLVSKREIGLH